MTSTAVARISAAAQSSSTSPLATSVTERDRPAPPARTGRRRRRRGAAPAPSIPAPRRPGGRCRRAASTVRPRSLRSATGRVRSRFRPAPVSPVFLRPARSRRSASPSLTDDSPFSTRPSTGTLAPARTMNTSPAMHVRERDFLELAVALAQHRRRLQVEQVPDRVGRARRRAPLEPLAEQHQRDHDCRGLEIDVLVRRAARATRRR